VIRLVILGEPASKANSRELATIGRGDNKRTILRKSDKALAYERDALRQIPPAARLRIEEPLRVTLRVWYATERPDLDESLILDCLQDRWVTPKSRDGTESPGRLLVQAGVYRNDRQVREKHVYHAIDKRNPRAEIIIESLPEDQAALPLVIEEHPDVTRLREIVELVDGEAEHTEASAALSRINAALCGI
jgi:hypothetical protein